MSYILLIIINGLGLKLLGQIDIRTIIYIKLGGFNISSNIYLIF